MTKKNIARFIELATGTPIHAYTDADQDRKAEFARLGKMLAREIAKRLGLAKGTYDVRYNPGGIAVCGDVHLHGDSIYITLEQSFLGPYFGFMYRSCKGRKDFMGGANQWMKWERLADLDAACEDFKRCMRKPEPIDDLIQWGQRERERNRVMS